MWGLVGGCIAKKKMVQNQKSAPPHTRMSAKTKKGSSREPAQHRQCCFIKPNAQQCQGWAVRGGTFCAPHNTEYYRNLHDGQCGVMVPRQPGPKPKTKKFSARCKFLNYETGAKCGNFALIGKDYCPRHEEKRKAQREFEERKDGLEPYKGQLSPKITPSRPRTVRGGAASTHKQSLKQARAPAQKHPTRDVQSPQAADEQPEEELVGEDEEGAEETVTAQRRRSSQSAASTGESPLPASPGLEREWNEVGKQWCTRGSCDALTKEKKHCANCRAKDSERFCKIHIQGQPNGVWRE